MRITISTRVEQEMLQVAAGFTRDLFVQLNPPGIPVRLLRFDGSKRGDEVHLELGFPGFPQRWISHISESAESANEVYFVDRGVELPFFLSFWQHRHRIVRQAEGSCIIDDIRFRGRFPFFSALLFPVLYLQFLYRKPVYRRVFRRS